MHVAAEAKNVMITHMRINASLLIPILCTRYSKQIHSGTASPAETVIGHRETLYPFNRTEPMYSKTAITATQVNAIKNTHRGMNMTKNNRALATNELMILTFI
jgi:hypothetical protein